MKYWIRGMVFLASLLVAVVTASGGQSTNWTTLGNNVVYRWERGDFKYKGDTRQYTFRVVNNARDERDVEIDVTYEDGDGKEQTDTLAFTAKPGVTVGGAGHVVIAKQIKKVTLKSAKKT
jgi:hypothetical protein